MINSSVILTLVFFVTCLGISEVTITKFNQQQVDKSWQVADIKGKEIKALLDLKLSEIYKINILETYIVSLNGKIQPTDIEVFLASLYKDSHYMRYIGIAPNNQITHLYPLAGNEKALGLNYKGNLAQWPAVERVMQEHKAYLAGPLELVEGTSGIIYLVPVFLNDGTYWGVISAAVNTSDLISAIETQINQTELQFALRNKEGKGTDDNSKVFYGNASLFNGDGVHVTIPVPSGNWEVVVKPIGGVTTLVKSFRIITVVLSLILSLIIYQFLFSKRQTKRNKLVESYLKSSKISLQTVLNSIPAEMAILNHQGVIVACNVAWLRYGINKPKLPGFPALGAPVGTHYVQTCKQADSGFMMEQDKAIRQGCGICGVLEGDLFHFNKEYKREDGSIAWYKIDATPIGDNEDNGVILMHSDISERKLNEENLRLSYSMKRAVLKSSPCAIMSISPLGYVEDYNLATTEMFDYSKDELARKDKTWLDSLIPKRLHEDEHLVLTQYTDNAVGSLINYSFEFIGLRQNGQEFPIELTITPIRTEENNFYSVFIRDLTTFKQAQTTLKQGLLEAEQANKVKSQFLAMMSHEIRTPLNVILGMQDLLVNTPLNVKQTEYVNIAAQAGTLLLRLVNDILDLTKVESGKLDLEQLDFDAVPHGRGVHAIISY